MMADGLSSHETTKGEENTKLFFTKKACKGKKKEREYVILSD